MNKICKIVPFQKGNNKINICDYLIIKKRTKIEKINSIDIVREKI